jgi:DNA (cytosine-5)-methyltransferase 1
MNKKPNRIQIPARLHPDTRALLERAAEDQRRSLSSIIDQCVRDQLQAKYGQLHPRLDRFPIGGKAMRFGSVCSGIEAASVAWHPLGWKAAWLSEIEPFPSAVLAHHYPTVPNLGDMTLLPERIASGEVEAPDLFCGGTPCQAFSVAGLRQSLDDDRGNLSLTFVEIANAIDNRRLDAGLVPAIIFWENVPGVLNTKDNAFGCFLGALAGEDAPLEPAGKRWTNAGCVYGPQRTVAWRVLDAQYFGVAQRRRRVFVVASARDGFDPAAVLFESEGVRRDTAPSREAGERIAPRVTNGPPFSRTENERVEAEAMVVAARMVAFGEHQVDGTASAMKAQDYKDATDLVAQPIPLNSMNVLRSADADPTTGCGIGEEGEAMFTLTKGNHHAVAQPITFGGQMSVPQTDVDLVQTLQAKNPMAVAYNISPGKGELKDDIHVTYAHVSKTIDASNSNPAMHQGGAAIVQTMAVRRLTPVECERLQGFPDGYTNIPWRKKPESPDGPRYKALGNSWAVPVVAWIGKRIQEAVQ